MTRSGLSLLATTLIVLAGCGAVEPSIHRLQGSWFTVNDRSFIRQWQYFGENGRGEYHDAEIHCADFTYSVSGSKLEINRVSPSYCGAMELLSGDLEFAISEGLLSETDAKTGAMTRWRRQPPPPQPKDVSPRGNTGACSVSHIVRSPAGVDIFFSWGGQYIVSGPHRAAREYKVSGEGNPPRETTKEPEYVYFIAAGAGDTLSERPTGPTRCNIEVISSNGQVSAKISFGGEYFGYTNLVYPDP